MKNRKTIAALVLVGTLSIAFSLTISTVFGASCVYTISQPGEPTHVVVPIERAQSGAVFYDYWSASAHTPFVEDGISKIYLYRDTASGELSLIMHHSMDNSIIDVMRVRFDFEGIPAGAYVSQSDDGPPAFVNSEFNLTREPEGRWGHTHNSDGGVLSGLPTDDDWCITIHPSNWEGLTAWYYQQEHDKIPLNMDKDLTICCSHPSPGPLFSDILVILPLGLVAGTLIIIHQRKTSS